MTAFAELGVMPEIIKAVEEMGWSLPTDIQAECIPLILGGGDVLAAAETGSGKTGAFALPALQLSHEALRPPPPSSKAAEAAGSAAAPEMPTRVMLSTSDRQANFAISEDGLLCQAREEHGWCGARANACVIGGAYYYEATVTDEGLCRVGWATVAASYDLGTDQHGYGYGGTGKASNAKQFNTYGEPYGINDTIGCYFNSLTGDIGFTKNGKDFGPVFNVPARSRNFGLYPAVVLKNAEMRFNFGETPFRCAPPVGYAGMTHAPPTDVRFSLPAAAAAAPATTGAGRGPLILVLEPSRELAQQTHQNFEMFSKYLTSPKIAACLCLGGVPAQQQLQEFKAGVDIVTGTPGRLIEHIENGSLHLSNVRFYVLDEADALQQAHEQILHKIHEKLPKNVQVLLFSATLHSPDIRRLADRITRFPIWVDLKGKDALPESVYHAYIKVDPITNLLWQTAAPRFVTDEVHKRDAGVPNTKTREGVSEAIKLLKPHMLVQAIRANRMEQAMIFVRTKVECDNLERFFQQLGARGGMLGGDEFSCVCLHGDRSVQERTANLEAFKSSEVKFLICTDVAARGIDVAELPFMINYDLPDKAEDYIHRTGRVGRADRMGLAVSLVGQHEEKVWYHKNCNNPRNCQNTTLLEQGGCTVWYQEPIYWQDIQQRIGEEALPLEAEKPFAAEGVVFGRRRQEKESSVQQLRAHADQLRGRVEELAMLEAAVQTRFWQTAMMRWH